MGKYMIFLLMALLMLTTSCAPDPLKQSFENAKVLVDQSKFGEAYPVLKDLCRKDPTKEEYCRTYDTVRRSLYEDDLKRIRARISSLKAENPLLPVKIIDDLQADVRKLEGYELKTQEFDNIVLQLENEHKLTQDRRQGETKKARDLFDEKKFRETFDVLNAVAYLDPDGINGQIKDLRDKAMQALYPAIKELVAKEDWRGAKKLLLSANDVDSGYKDVKALLKEATEKDTVEYDLKKADEARRVRKYDVALKFYEKAMKHDDAKERVTQLYYQTKQELCDYYFQVGIELMEQELNRQAYESFKKAYEIIESLPIEKRRIVKVPKKEMQKYFDGLYLKAKKAEDTESLGLAFQYYKLISLLSPSYPEIKENLRKVEEKIANRSLKSMAVMPFKSPKIASESGNMLTSSIMLTLYNELRQDMKIIERESMDVLLKEYELTMAAKGADKPKETSSFQISSADFLLLGDVLDYRVESSVQEGNKVVRVKTRVDFLPNPDYEEWQQHAKKLEQTGQPVPPSPPKLIEKPVFEDIKYKVAFYKKVGILNISYRIVDTARGKIIHTGMVDIKKDANDESSEGVEIGEFKIPFRMAQLPTDTELIKKASDEGIAKITGDVKMLFKDPEDKYLKQAETLEKDGNLKEAFERYSDAFILMKRKNKDAAAVESKINKYLDALSSL